MKDNFIRDLAQDREEKGSQSFERRACFPRPAIPRDPPIRPSHLKARQRFPTHPLFRISRVLPAKLTPIDREKLDHAELTRRILLKFDQWKPRNA